MAVVAYIAVGSNIQPEANIPAALDKLMSCVRVTASSTFYHTAALQRPGGPEFLNGVWQIETDLDARALKFTVLRRIEEELGRTRTADRYAPRTIDLDLLVYGSAAINEPDLRVPDPDIRSRPFLAAALLELAPELVLADSGERLAALASRLCADGTLTADREMTEQLTRIIHHRDTETQRTAGEKIGLGLKFICLLCASASLLRNYSIAPSGLIIHIPPIPPISPISSSLGEAPPHRDCGEKFSQRERIKQ